VDDGCIFGKFADFAGDSVIEPGADGKQYIALADGRIGSIIPVDSNVAHIQRVVGGNGAFAHDGGDYRNLGLLGQFGHSLLGMGNLYPSAQEEYRAFGGV